MRDAVNTRRRTAPRLTAEKVLGALPRCFDCGQAKTGGAIRGFVSTSVKWHEMCHVFWKCTKSTFRVPFVRRIAKKHILAKVAVEATMANTRAAQTHARKSLMRGGRSD